MERLLKSNENIKAASYMVKSSMYASSVHASYYGCFLFMKHIGNYKLSLAYEMQDDPAKSVISHDSVYDTIYKGGDNKIKKMLRSKFSMLHRNRIEADYTEHEINKTIAEESISIANEVRNSLSNYFNITL